MTSPVPNLGPTIKQLVICLSLFSWPLFAAEAEKKIEELMQIHYLNNKLKSPFDQISVEGDQVRIQVWRDIPVNADPKRVECLGYQWLLSGRGKKMGSGADAVFKAFPQLQNIQLALVEVTYSTESVNGQGQLKKKAEVKPYLRMSLGRKELQRFSIDQDLLKRKIRESTSECLAIGRKLNISKEVSL